MNPNTMTLDECRDWLAREDGWTPIIVEPWDCPGWGRGNWRTVDHPYPPTLDGAAGAMPDEYAIKIVTFRGVTQGTAWPAKLGPLDSPANVRPTFFVENVDEILARYRLAVACRMAQKEQA